MTEMALRSRIRTICFRAFTLLVAVAAAVVAVAMMSVPAWAASKVLVTDVSPDGGATSLAADGNVTAAFSKAMKASTVKGTTFYLKKQGSSAAIPATVSYSSTSKTATLNPESNLEAGATYTATIKGGKRGVRASNGDLLGGTRDNTATFANGRVTWSFTVANDPTPPETTITGGPSGLTNDDTPTFTFSSSDPDATFECRLTEDTETLGSFASCSSGDSFGPLATDGEYTFEVKAVDAAGNESSTESRSFTLDTTAPARATVDLTDASDTGASNTDNLTSDSTPTFTFSSDADATIKCKLIGNGSTWSFDNCSSPKEFSTLAAGKYTLEVEAVDAAGNSDPTPASITFTVDIQGPQVSSVSPATAAKGVELSTNVEATFSEAIDQSSITDQNFTLTEQGSSTPVGATVSYDSATKKATLDPNSDLSFGKTYTALIKRGSSGVKDLAGNTLNYGNDYSWTFASKSAVGVTPSPLNFTPDGAVCNTTITKTVTITNSTAGQLDLYPSASSRYSVASDVLSIASGESRDLSVSWTSPTSGQGKGSWNGSLYLKDADGNTKGTGDLVASYSCGFIG